MESPPIYSLPQEMLQNIFSSLPLRQIMICRSVCKLFYQILMSSSFVHLYSTENPPLSLLALRPPDHHRQPPNSPFLLHAFDPNQNQWIRFYLGFLPFRSLHPIASSTGLVYVRADSPDSLDSNKLLIACNPLTGQFRVLPQLGSAWFKHGSVLVDSADRVMVLTENGSLFLKNSNHWLKFSSDLPSKPRSPILVSNSVYTLCDVGPAGRNKWRLYSCKLSKLTKSQQFWKRLKKRRWGDVFGILERPRLVRGMENRLLMIGGLKSPFSLNSPCSTILILRLDLDLLEWEEAGRMPVEMYRIFQESSKFEVFGMGERVIFSAKRHWRLALWEFGKGGGGGEWRWIDGLQETGDGPCRGFVFEKMMLFVTIRELLLHAMMEHNLHTLPTNQPQ